MLSTRQGDATGGPGAGSTVYGDDSPPSVLTQFIYYLFCCFWYLEVVDPDPCPPPTLPLSLPPPSSPDTRGKSACVSFYCDFSLIVSWDGMPSSLPLPLPLPFLWVDVCRISSSSSFRDRFLLHEPGAGHLPNCLPRSKENTWRSGSTYPVLSVTHHSLNLNVVALTVIGVEQPLPVVAVTLTAFFRRAHPKLPTCHYIVKATIVGC